MNQLHVVPLNEGLRRKKALWRPAGRKELESIALAPWASRRRQDLLDLLDQLTPKIQELTHALEEEVEKHPVTRLLMTHPGVGESLKRPPIHIQNVMTTFARACPSSA
jgi:transposase